MRKMRLLAAILCICLTGTAGAETLYAAPLAQNAAAQDGMVRVYLSSLGNPSTLTLTISGSYTVNSDAWTLPSGAKATVGFNAGTGNLTLTVNGASTNMGTSFRLRRHETSGTNGVRIAQARASGNLYPGDLSFTAQKNGSSYKLYTVAHIFIEDYLYGVLPYEMGNSSPLEALKAQAVSARTYTLRAMLANGSTLYDVVDTTSDQVYSGTPSGNANCVSAVDSTRGIVARNGDSFTATYYTASNGGQIESVRNLWGSTAYPYITVKDDPYDYANPDSRVKTLNVSSAGTQASAALNTLLANKAAAAFGAGAVITAVTAVTPHTPRYASPSRLYTKMDFAVLALVNGASKSGTLTFDIFNELEAPLGMSINSSVNELWTVASTSSGYQIQARRYGHGTGMSQRGAMQMAKMGYGYAQILGFYFDGCKRVQYTFTKSILSAVAAGQTSSEQVTPVDPAEIEGDEGTVSPANPVLATVLTDGANLRMTAGTAGYVIKTLAAGETVTAISTDGTWCRAQSGVMTGYVLQSALSISQTPATLNVDKPGLGEESAAVASTATSLNLRQRADTSSSVICEMPRGDALIVTQRGDPWCAVRYQGVPGYAMTRYIAFIASAQPTATPAPQAEGSAARVNTASGSLNLRASASKQSLVLCAIPQNAVVTVSSRGDTWCGVSYNGFSGYAMTAFLAFSDSTATAAPATQAPATQAPAAFTSRARVTTASGSLNLRAQARTGAKVLTTIPQNTVITLLSTGAQWCQTIYGGYTGHVMTAFLTFISDDAPTSAPLPTVAPEPVGEALRAKVTTASGSLNLRESPRSGARVLVKIPRGAIIDVTSQGGEWCAASYAGYAGYVMTSFLTFLSADATQTPAAAQTPSPGALTARVVTASGSLNLRESAYEYARVLITVPQYAIITVFDRDTVWSRVSYGGYTGYVMTAFLSFDASVPTAALAITPTPAPQIDYDRIRDATLTVLDPPRAARVNSELSTLNLRAGCETLSTLILEMPKNDTVLVDALGETWCHVIYESRDGYCMTRYLLFLE